MKNKGEKVWILGPCSMENEKVFLESLEEISKVMEGRYWFMKASFDKANRTSLHGERGRGLRFGQSMWAYARERFPEAKFITDVHEAWQVKELVGVVDAIQIPAFLCRQTDLIVECARNFDIVLIKRMQHLGPNNLIKSLDKIKQTNPACEAWICDRGTAFGYDHLIMDFTIIPELKKHFDRVIFDVTHAVQRSRAKYGVQADRDLAYKYFLSADIFEYDGVFAEVHPNPPTAISDADSQLYLSDLDGLITKTDMIEEALR